MPRFGDGFMSTELPITCEVALMQFVIQPSSGVCRKNEFLSANSVMLCVSVVKLPGKTFTTEARCTFPGFVDTKISPNDTVREGGVHGRNATTVHTRV